MHIAPNHDDFIPGNLRYVYLLKFEGNNREENDKNATFQFNSIKNAVTGTQVKPKIIYLNTLDELPMQEKTISYHPWKLPVIENKNITLQGETVLTENLIINTDDTLIIKPGTTIKLAKDVSIISYGQITAKGTPTQPITFIPSTNKPWGAIAIQGKNANNSTFENCIIEGGSGTKHELVHYTGMLSAYNTEITINNCIFKNNKKEDDTFNAKHSQVKITNSTFTNTFSDAIDFDFTTGTIENNKFDNINGDAIDLMTSTPTIKNNHITGAADKGISIGEKSNPTITNNKITNNNIGIAIKDQSNPTITNNTITNNQIGITAYQKNWQYGGGGFGTIQNTNLCHNIQPLIIQNNSRITINNKTCTEEKCEYHCPN
ncbi:right-handed parallel beta-helix repeat-containing protein [Candidatus Woesearchaeota archaeon]|nr:right-handed parallel beta-helix repeat-containing protein [Candidatus Woesearchaeota archaeon]